MILIEISFTGRRNRFIQSFICWIRYIILIEC